MTSTPLSSPSRAGLLGRALAWMAVALALVVALLLAMLWFGGGHDYLTWVAGQRQGGPLRRDVAGNVLVHWPLDAQGAHWVDLHIPKAMAAEAAIGQPDYVVPPHEDGTPPPAPVPNGKQMLFNVLWPEMATEDASNRAEFWVPGGGRFMHALVTAFAVGERDGRQWDTLELDRQLAMRGIETVCTPTGLPVPRNVDCVHVQAIEKASRPGLRHVGRDFAAHPIDRSQLRQFSFEDAFLASDDGGGLRTVIVCNADDLEAEQVAVGMTPQCNQYFVVRKLNAVVDVGYRKQYLSQWSEIQSRWTNVLNSYAQGADQSSTTGNPS